jgi:hypothetical protein
MSIVLVIIALIIGGTLVADSVKRAAALQQVVSDIGRFQQAIQNFRDKYHELPGDMPNAESFWGSDPAGCPSGNGSATPATATCNGNGDGMIGGCESATTCVSYPLPNAYEWFRAWQQLADAGMIDGAYTGTYYVDSVEDTLPGRNIPAWKGMKGAGYVLRYFKDGAGDANFYAGTYGNVLFLGGRGLPGVNNFWQMAPVLTPSEALGIDTKMDDGQPASGKVMAMPPSNGNVPNCTTNSTPAKYNTAYDDYACSLIFTTPF